MQGDACCNHIQLGIAFINFALQSTTSLAHRAQSLALVSGGACLGGSRSGGGVGFLGCRSFLAAGGGWCPGSPVDHAKAAAHGADRDAPAAGRVVPRHINKRVAAEGRLLLASR